MPREIDQTLTFKTLAERLAWQIQVSEFEAEVRKLIKKVFNSRKVSFNPEELNRLLFDACSRQFISVIKLLLKRGAKITDYLMTNMKKRGLTLVSKFLSYAVEIDEYEDINFDLLCSMFEPNNHARDENIIYLLKKGADPTAYSGAVYSLICWTAFSENKQSIRAFKLLQATFFEKCPNEDDSSSSSSSEKSPVGWGVETSSPTKTPLGCEEETLSPTKTPIRHHRHIKIENQSTC